MKISEKIINYAIWYYLKYYPSKNKLRKKLEEKFGPKSENGQKYGGLNEEEIDYIINEKLKNIIVEDEVIVNKIESYRKKGKSKIYIKQKLYQREESKELIEKYLNEIFIDGEEENILKEYNKLKEKYEKNKIIEKLIRKGFRYEDIKQLII